MHFGKFSSIDLWSLDNFNFSNSDILNWVDGCHFLGDCFFKNLTGEKIKEMGSVGFADFFSNHFIDSFSDLLLLGSQGVVSFSLLVGRFAGEGDNEDSDDISIT